MSINESKSIHANEDWGVVLQSVPSKSKKEILKRLGEIFQLEKRDAEQILSKMPLILVDNISFGLAARIKKFFQKIGAVTETTNHEMVKKNCFQILWPQTPDLSFFMKDETSPVVVPAQGKKDVLKPSETMNAPEVSSAAQPVVETPAVVLQNPQTDDEKSVPVLPVGGGSDWERRAKELNEKLRRIHEAKQELHAQHAEATEKVKNEFQQQIEEEKQKSGEIAKAYEDLQKEAQKHEALTREGEEWRSRAVALGEKVRELETNLMQKSTAVDALTHQKNELAQQSEKIVAETQQELMALRNREQEYSGKIEQLERHAQNHDVLAREGQDLRSRADALAEKVRELEASLQQKTSAVEYLIQQKDDMARQSEKTAAEAHHELSTLRDREQEFSKKIEGLERNAHEMTDALRSREDVLAQFEKQIQELAEKAQGYELLRQEHAQLAQERATIRHEFNAKLVEQEVRLAKADEENRRYRSRIDRKTAAATRELGEWIRGVDTIRQGLQKLILFLGSESVVLDSERKSNLKSPLTRGPDAPNAENS